MRFRWLAIFPLLYAAGFIALAWWLRSGDLLTPFVLGQRILIRVLAAVGCFAAMSVFDRMDHLRRAWLWLGAGTIVILLRDLLRLVPAFQPAAAGPGAQALLSGLGILSNLALLCGIWTLARSWKMAAIDLGGRSGVVAVTVTTAVLALAVAGPGALESAQEVARGDWNSLVLLVSAVVDIITLCLITPLLLTAVALRGGLFSWPWGLVTASQLSWLFYDAAAALDPGSLPAGIPLPEVFRGLAQNYLFVAGLAQLFVIQHVRRAAARDDRGSTASSAA